MAGRAYTVVAIRLNAPRCDGGEMVPTGFEPPPSRRPFRRASSRTSSRFAGESLVRPADYAARNGPKRPVRTQTVSGRASPRITTRRVSRVGFRRGLRIGGCAPSPLRRLARTPRPPRNQRNGWLLVRAGAGPGRLRSGGELSSYPPPHRLEMVSWFGGCSGRDSEPDGVRRAPQ